MTFAAHAEDVDLSGGDAGRRLRLPERQLRRHRDPRLLDAGQASARPAFALQAAQQQLAFFNDYFGIKYPFGKLDIIGIPDFAAGAMENAGAITFRERALLVDEADRRRSINARTSRRWSPTRSRTSGSATS